MKGRGQGSCLHIHRCDRVGQESCTAREVREGRPAVFEGDRPPQESEDANQQVPLRSLRCATLRGWSPDLHRLAASDCTKSSRALEQ